MLGPSEHVPGRPFTDVHNMGRDVSILHEMVDDLRGILAEIKAGRREFVPYDKMAWKVDEMTHRLLICDADRLRDREKTYVVGFFGARVSGVNPGPLEEANTEVVAEFGAYPGILSYSSMQMAEGTWSNLVLHDDPIDREYWKRSERHAEAARTLSPIYYRHIRIHNAEMIGPLSGDPVIKVLRTKYYDYSETPEWRGERDLVS